MDNKSVKRRRPHSRDENLAESVLHATFPFPAHGLPPTTSAAAQLRNLVVDNPSLHVHLHVPLVTLLDLDRPENKNYILQQALAHFDSYHPPSHPPSPRTASRHGHRHKRPRTHTDISMAPPYTDDPYGQEEDEKPSLSPHQAKSRRFLRRSPVVPSESTFVTNWSNSSLAECFAGISVCPPCSTYESQPGYQAIPASSSYDDPRERPYSFDGSLVRPHDAYAPTSAAADPAGLFACGDPAVVAQYMQAYPALQPDRVIGAQPVANREDMVYPDSSSGAKFITPPEHDYHVLGMGPPGNVPVMASIDRNGSGSGPFVNPVRSASVDDSGKFAVGAPRYNAVMAYGSSDALLKREVELDVDASFSNDRSAAKRGPFKDHDERERTAHTRKIGSCIRCRMQRIRCNLDPDDDIGPCLTCKKVASNKIWRLPCLRLKITDVRLFKPGQVKGHEWTNRWKDSVVDDIGSWASTDTKVICVTEGYTGKHVRLRVRRFQPQEGDKLDRSWVSNGTRKTVEIPPYAIVDMDEAKTSFDSYIKQGLVDCCKRLLGPREKLLWQTYSIALRLVADPSTPENERNLLMKTFNLWMSIRMTTKSFEIVGNETLGMSRDIIADRQSTLHGKIPLPPVMGAQIDSVLIHQVQPKLRRDTLEELQKMTQEKKQKTWLTTYLVTFILLHNMSLITKHDAEYARKHGMKRRFAREDKVKEYHTGAVTLLAYFHYCNRGIYPFSDDCKDQDLRGLAGLDAASEELVRYTRRYAALSKRQWEDLWAGEEYEDEYYYVSQLYENNWQPRSMG